MLHLIKITASFNLLTFIKSAALAYTVYFIFIHLFVSVVGLHRCSKSIGFNPTDVSVVFFQGFLSLNRNDMNSILQGFENLKTPQSACYLLENTPINILQTK